MKNKNIKLNNGIILTSKKNINNKIAFIKIILSTDEKEIINNFIESIDSIRTKNNSMPQIITFNRNNFISVILSRALKFTDGSNLLMPSNKWNIEDISEKLGVFNDEYELFEYLELPQIKVNKTLEESMKDANEYKLFIKSQLNKIINIGTITSKILNSTYSNKINHNVIIILETEPIIEKIDEFKNNYPEVIEHNIERYMKMNFRYSRLVGITICQLTDKEYIESDGENNNVI